MKTEIKLSPLEIRFILGFVDKAKNDYFFNAGPINTTYEKVLLRLEKKFKSAIEK